jgi:hypothetical protein
MSPFGDKPEILHSWLSRHPPAILHYIVVAEERHFPSQNDAPMGGKPRKNGRRPARRMQERALLGPDSGRRSHCGARHQSLFNH